MNASIQESERTVREVVAAVDGDLATLSQLLDANPRPIYVTDAHGVIVHYNQACIPFAGRTPQAGQDRWCVTWRLRTDSGKFLPHDQCPMAVAVKTRTPVRGVSAIAERPDGTHVTFIPLATPVLGENGELKGAVNLFIDVTGPFHMEELREQALRCRRLASAVMDRAARRNLQSMASDYETLALSLERALAYGAAQAANPPGDAPAC
jgi:PAS domain-containing protein